MSAETQHQTRENVAEAQSFLSDLSAWTRDVKRKDAALKAAAAAPPTVPVRGAAAAPSPPPPPRAPAGDAARAPPARGAAAGGAQPAGAPAAPPDSADAWRERGNAAYKAGDFALAEAHYGASLAAAHTAAAFANRAMARLKLGRAGDAAGDCDAALALEPTHVKALQRRAAAHTALGCLLDAACDLDAAARLEPGNKALRVERAAAVAVYEATPAGRAAAPASTTLHIAPLPLSARAAPLPQPPPPEPLATPVVPAAAPPPKRGKVTIVEVTDADELPAEPSLPPPPSPPPQQHAQQQVLSASPPVRSPTAGASSPAATESPSRRSVTEVAAAAAAKLAARPLEAPRTGTEFESAWRRAAGQPEQQLQLLQLVEPSRFPALLKNSLSAPVLCAVVRAALTLLLSREPAAALAVLRGLTAVPRFATATMLLAGADKAALLAEWDAAEAAAPPDVAPDLRALRAPFRCAAK